MKVPNKPGKINNDIEIISKQGMLNAFAKEIVHGNVILLLGHESLLRVPSSEEAQEDENLSFLRECNGSMEKWMNTLRQRFYNPYSSSLKRFYVDALGENSPYPQLDINELNPEILSLIESKAFKVILTTNYDPLIEEAMEKTWGGKGSIDVKNFDDNEKKDLSSISSLVSPNEIKPTLYYLFGKATDNVSNYGNPQFVVDEEDYIGFIKNWMAQSPKELKSFIAGKRILAVGCKFDYWLFRFFWRVVLEAETTNVDFKHLLALSLNSSPSDLKLRELFHHYKLTCPKDVNEFLKGLNVTIRQQQKIAFADERRNGGIFLSYCSEDYERTLNLFYRLRDAGFNVWMDCEKLYTGKDYNTDIKKAIAAATIFIPILSRTVASHLPAIDPYNPKDPNFHFYRDVEWNYAVLKSENDKKAGMKSLEIIPIAFDDYNPRQNSVPKKIQDAYPEIFGKTLDPYNKAGFTKVIKVLKDILNS